MEEARQHPRFAVDIAGALLVGERSLAGSCRNVSRGGLCAFTSEALALGTELTARISLVFDTATASEPLELPSRIVWATALGDEFQLGVAFHPPNAEQLEFLDLFLRYIEEGRAIERGAAADPEPDDPFAS